MVKITKGERIQELQRMIALLQRDLNYVRNNSVRRIKEQRLRAYREDLLKLSCSSKRNPNSRTISNPRGEIE